MNATSPRHAIITRIGWATLTVLATLIGIASLRYGLPTVPFALVATFVTDRTALVIHAVAASVALLIGPWQFLPGVRRQRPWLHRYGGRIYAAAVVVAWIASIPIALHAKTGAIASAGFLGLGAAWLATTAIGVVLILGKNVARHRRWMIRSYALTASAITLRIYLGIAAGLQLPPDLSYSAIAWLCWVPTLVVTELFLLAVMRPKGLSKPAWSSRHEAAQ